MHHRCILLAKVFAILASLGAFPVDGAGLLMGPIGPHRTGESKAIYSISAVQN